MKRLFYLFFGLALLMPVFAATGVSASSQEKIKICHVLPEEASHTYQYAEVNSDAADGEGENDHTMHERDGIKDVIPITDLTGDGKIDQKDCDKAAGEEEVCELTAPTLVSPANGAVNLATKVTLKWGAVDGADSYEVQYAFTSVFAKDKIVSTANTQLTLDFPSDATVYWKVRAITDNKKEEDCVSSFSTAWNFKTIGEATGGGEEEEDGKGGGVAAAPVVPRTTDTLVLEGFGAGPGVLPETGTNEKAGLIFSLISSGVVTWLIRRKEVLGG